MVCLLLFTSSLSEERLLHWIQHVNTIFETFFAICQDRLFYYLNS